MSGLVISLTTIPTRMHLIMPTLHNLLDQSANVQEIRLNIPESYRRFPKEDVRLPTFPNDVNVVRVKSDYGPATKILPTLEAYADQDVDILFCDDDQHYDRDWAQRFVNARRTQPQACIVENGYDLPGADCSELQPRAKRRAKDWRYRLARAATGLRKKPSPYVQSGYVDVFQGYRGVMLKSNSLPHTAWDIPDVLWTVDDVWLSGQLATAGVPVWLMAVEKGFPRAPRTHAIDALQFYTYRNHNRQSADASCIAYFQKHYGIWQGATI